MIISNSRQYVFVHVPRTGGTSITQALQPTTAWNDIVVGGTPYGERMGDVWGDKWDVGKHSPATALRALVGAERWTDYFTFALVRHPVDRLVSLYAWARARVRQRRWRRWTRHLLPSHREPLWDRPVVRAYLDAGSFSAFVRHPALGNGRLARPQRHFLTDTGGEPRLIDHVGRLEQADADFATVCDRIGVSVMLPHTNADRRDDVTVTPADRNVVARRYGADFDAFGYDPVP